MWQHTHTGVRLLREGMKLHLKRHFRCTVKTPVTKEVPLQPGVASVYCSIVQQTRNGVELYVREFSELVGMSFCEIR